MKRQENGGWLDNGTVPSSPKLTLAIRQSDEYSQEDSWIFPN
jgi:hypothetical protein